MKLKTNEIVVLAKLGRKTYQVATTEAQQRAVCDLLGQMHGGTIKIHKTPLSTIKIYRKK